MRANVRFKDRRVCPRPSKEDYIQLLYFCQLVQKPARFQIQSLSGSKPLNSLTARQQSSEIHCHLAANISISHNHAGKPLNDQREKEKDQLR
jgi:hypothetical protein